MMKEYKKEVQIRWADLDPNFHLRHSVYYDWGTFCRFEFLNEHGFTPQVMIELQSAPILFREECIFKKEVRANDNVIINLELLKAKKNFSLWTIQHEIVKNENILAAILTIDGAWFDTAKRKLAPLPQKMIDVFEQMPRNKNFQWLE